jgi:hypothetical protein
MSSNAAEATPALKIYAIDQPLLTISCRLNEGVPVDGNTPPFSARTILTDVHDISRTDP